MAKCNLSHIKLSIFLTRNNADQQCCPRVDVQGWLRAVFMCFACLQLNLKCQVILAFVARFWAVLTDLTPGPLIPLGMVYCKYMVSI